MTRTTVSDPEESQWLVSPEDWQAFFDAYERVVLIANSDEVAIAEVVKKHGEGALFVFFNKVYKVLDAPFEAPCLLVARSSPSGANIVYRREVEEVLSYFRKDALLGILNLACADTERFSPIAAFEGRRAGRLSLAGYFREFYPTTHLPTSGFALALWLAETCRTEVHLEGFSAKRSLRWKLFADHDWTFEQTSLRLLARAGRLHMNNVEPSNAYVELARRFPEIGDGAVAAAAVEVLGNRLESASLAIDNLVSLTKFQGRVDRLLRRLKPATRKQRDKAASGKSGPV
ncbi:3-deoxy-manno-octulosonate cytidylyltransferase [Fulvimarina endophytica]|uniref:3-deoxy-manno-octulosonate cytidylyltransferase n=1 Tax=Fulvimarina endophytica TaxID=2293836 RepID=A0A371X0W2_9HYPH|nr:3-deoxy-manno-octulosonate cytidylyltransferase [Fulvimarina endophytica]RFC62853.1 3-deoxy-manno-octulosonate cytidylyltransferase [Fulvimarina endophytica]